MTIEQIQQLEREEDLWWRMMKAHDEGRKPLFDGWKKAWDAVAAAKQPNYAATVPIAEQLKENT